MLKENVRSKLNTYDICLIGIFTAIICIISQISIPMPYGVPITMQTFIICLTSIIIGYQRATIATFIYIIIGALGFPVFSSFTGGLAIIFGPTGGFILSFPLMAFINGKFASKNTELHLYLGIILSMIVNYFCGMLVFSLVTQSNLYNTFIICVLPFIPTTIIKIFLLIIINKKIKNSQINIL